MNKSKQKGEAMVIVLGIVVVLFTFINSYTHQARTDAAIQADTVVVEEQVK